MPVGATGTPHRALIVEHTPIELLPIVANLLADRRPSNAARLDNASAEEIEVSRTAANTSRLVGNSGQQLRYPATFALKSEYLRLTGTALPANTTLVEARQLVKAKKAALTGTSKTA